MPPRTRFEEVMRADFSELRNRVVAEHLQEVGRLERRVHELEDEIASLRKEFADYSGCVEEELSPLSPLKFQRTRSNLSMPRDEASSRQSNPRRIEEVLVKPPALPSGAAVEDGSAGGSLAFDNVMPAGFGSPTSQSVQKPRGSVCSRRCNMRPASADPTRGVSAARQRSQSDSDEDNGDASKHARAMSREQRRSLSSSSLHAGGLRAVEDQDHRRRGSATSITRWLSQLAGSRRGSLNAPSLSDTPTTQAATSVPPSVNLVSPAKDAVEVIVDVPNLPQTQEEEEGEDEAAKQSSIETVIFVQPRRPSMALSVRSMSMDGDDDFEVAPEWRTQRSFCRRRGIETMNSLDFGGRNSELYHPSFHSTGMVQMWLWNRMLSPSSRVNVVWLVLTLLCMMWDLVVIPLDLFNPEEGDFVRAMFWMVRLFWTLDFFKNFVTGRLQADGFVEMRPPQVAKQYMLTWLPIDIVVLLCDWSVPFLGSTSGTALKGLRLLRLGRLLRLVKVIQVESVLSQYACSETVVLLLGLVKLIVVLLAVAHVFACLWYRIGIGSLDDSASSSGWVAHHGLTDASLQERYAWSLHWSLAQLTGEVIFEPRNLTERSFAIFVMVVTFLASSLFVSGITTSMTRLMIVAGSHSSQLQALRRYLVGMRISSSLTTRLQRNVQHVLGTEKRTAPQILSLISEPLRVELYYELHSPALLFHPFFKGYDQFNPAGVRRVCHVAATTVLLSRGDIVFSDYEAPACPRMYFVHGSGGLRYKQQSGATEFLEHGDWVCEPVLWTSWIHCGTLTALHECELLALDARAFRDVANLFPTRHACKYATAFVEQLNRVDRASLSDLWRPNFGEMEGIMPGLSEQENITWEGLGLTGATSSEGLSKRLRALITRSNQAGRGTWIGWS